MGNKKTSILLAIIAICMLTFAIWFLLDTMKVKESENVINTIPLNEIKTEEKIKNFLDFTIYNSQNEEISLYSFKGKPILIYFWSETNQDSINQLKMIQDLYNIYCDDINFVVITMFDGEYANVKTVEKVLSDNKISMPNYYDLDSNAKNTYMLTKPPVTILVDRNGKLINTKEGLLDSDPLSASEEILIEEFSEVESPEVVSNNQ